MFSTNEAQERDVYRCFWPFSQAEKEEGCECVCVPECVTVAWTFNEFDPFEPFPIAELQLWLNLQIWRLLQRVQLLCNTTEPNPVFVTLYWLELVGAVIYGYSHPGFFDAGGEGVRDMAWERPWGNKPQSHKPTAQSKEQGYSFRSGCFFSECGCDTNTTLRNKWHKQ